MMHSAMILCCPDGCVADVTTLPSPNNDSTLDVVLEWEEANLGDNVSLPCPCGNLSALGEINFDRSGYRRCGGNFTAGAEWEDGMVSDCDFTLTTRQLCSIAEVSPIR